MLGRVLLPKGGSERQFVPTLMGFADTSPPKDLFWLISTSFSAWVPRLEGTNAQSLSRPLNQRVSPVLPIWCFKGKKTKGRR